MIEIEARIRHAATDETLRAAASELWKRHALTLFDPHDERHGLRVSDAGQCVRKLWHLVNGAKESFEPMVQLFNLDEGTLTGCWWACLLAASLEADGYKVELEAEVDHDGTPGHIDLFYFDAEEEIHGLKVGVDRGVVEFKKTYWSGAREPAEVKRRYQVLQLMRYCAAKKVERGALVTVAPAARSAKDKISVEWFALGDWVHALLGETMRQQAALGPVEPEGDPDEPWRCRGCFVTSCAKNPDYAQPIEQQLRASLEVVK